MFHDIPQAVSDRMRHLESLAAEIKNDDPRGRVPLWQVPPESGKFLALLAAGSPEGRMIEIGTSGGYSGLWLSLAAQASGKKLTTFEINEFKIKLATETFQSAGVTDVVTLVQGTVQEHSDKIKDVAFCFLDASKNVYRDCYDLVVPNLVPGGILTADNMISHADELTEFGEYVMQDDRVDAIIDPIGSGVLVVRRV